MIRDHAVEEADRTGIFVAAYQAKIRSFPAPYGKGEPISCAISGDDQCAIEGAAIVRAGRMGQVVIDRQDRPPVAVVLSHPVVDTVPDDSVPVEHSPKELELSREPPEAGSLKDEIADRTGPEIEGDIRNTIERYAGHLEHSIDTANRKLGRVLDPGQPLLFDRRYDHAIANDGGCRVVHAEGETEDVGGHHGPHGCGRIGSSSSRPSALRRSFNFSTRSGLRSDQGSE